METRTRIPLINCTDLYHPHQDVGDNFDIITAYALPEVDLRAVILDVTDYFRGSPDMQRPELPNPKGPREPGIVPIEQMNYIFDRQVPYGVSPFNPMRSMDDQMRDAPTYQQSGVELILKTLRESTEPVTIQIFCSCRAVAVAFNREPELFLRKVKRVLVSAGTTSAERFDFDYSTFLPVPPKPGSKGYVEWNVELDRNAFVRLLRSGLAVALFPCASDRGPFAMHRHSSFYDLKSLSFVRQMRPQLRSYLAYAFHRTLRHDFLRAMDEEPVEGQLKLFDHLQRHPVWETGVWMELAGRKLVRNESGEFRFIPADEVRNDHVVLRDGQHGCHLNIDDDGRFSFALTDEPSRFSIYDRGEDLEMHAAAMRQALTALYLSF